MSGRRAKQHRRSASSDFNRVVPAQSRAAWKDRLTAAGLLTGVLIPFVPTATLALPGGGNVTSGAATISTPTGTSMRIDQTTDRLIMDWTRFNIAANESVRFQQPSAASIALNRVLGPEPTAIFGSLSANGQIVLINPSGILFGAGSRVDVGALTASTLNMRNQDFLAGQYRFTQDPALANAAVVNQGVITAGPGGYVALLGAATRNEGVIQAQLGSIALAAGRAATLDMRGDGLIQFVVSDAVAGNVISPDGKPLASYVSNTGTLQADGGMVTLQAKAAGDVIRSVVNQEGIVRATSLVNHGGVIKLLAGDDVANTGQIGWQANLGKVQSVSGTVTNYGTLDVSAGEAGAMPGQVTLAGEYVGHAGTILAQGADQASGGRVLLTSSKETVVTPSGSIETSGAGAGAAGNVVVWSDSDTIFHGHITARGGLAGGDGGNVEVSGYQNLNFRGTADLSAAHGRTGRLLLDPTTITITGGSGDGAADGTATFQGAATAGTIAFTDATPTTVYESEIEGLNADIVLQAKQTITTSGTFGSAQVLLQNNRNLTLQTRNQVGDGAGGIDLTASADGANLEFKTQGTGTITITGSTDGGAAGNVTLGKLTTQGGAIDVTSNNGTITLKNNLSTKANAAAAAGAVTLTGAMVLGADVTIDTDATTTDANITLSGQIDGAHALTLNAGSGNIRVQAASRSFDGVGSYVLVNSTFGLGTGDATIGAWVNLDSGSRNGSFVKIGTETDGSGGDGFAIGVGGTTFDDTGNHLIVLYEGVRWINTNVNIGTGWHHVAVTLNASGYPTVYLDGTSVYSDSAGAPRAPGSMAGVNDTQIGGYTGSGSENRHAQALIAEVQIYNRALAANEVSQIKVAPSWPLLSGLVGYWPLMGGATEADRSGGANTGTLVGPTISTSTPTNVATYPIGWFAQPTSLTVTGGTINTQGTWINGPQSFTGATTLNSNLYGYGSTISITGAMTLANNVTLDSTYISPAGANISVTGAIDADAAANSRTLTLTAGTAGNVTLSSGVGGTQPLQTLTVTSANSATLPAITTRNGGISVTATNITLGGDLATNSTATAGAVVLTGPVTLTGNPTITTDAGTTDANITFSSTINGAHDLTLTAGAGDVLLSGTVGGSQPLTSFTINSANAASLPVMTVNGPLIDHATITTLNGNLTETFTSIGAVVLAATVTVNAIGDDMFLSTFDGAHALTLQAGGDIHAGGTIGGTTRLTSLTVSTPGGYIDLPAVNTTGAQSYTSAVETRLNGNLNSNTAGAITVTGAARLVSGAITVQTAGLAATDDITFTSTINGNQDLTLTAGAGDVLVSGPVGGSQAVNTFTVTNANTATLPAITTRDGGISVTANAITLNGDLLTNSIATAGPVVLTGAVTLGADLTINTDAATTDANMTLSGQIDGAHALTLNAGSGNITVQAASRSFNGVAGFVSVTDVPALSSSNVKSVSVWIKRNSLGTFLERVINEQSDGSNAWLITVPQSGSGDENAAVLTVIVGGAQVDVKTPNNSLNLTDTWYHLVAEWNGTSVTAIYINGVSQTLQAPSAAYLSGGTTRLAIGNRTDGLRTFDGQIADVQIYNRTLSSTEVSQIQANSSAVTSGLVGFWPLMGGTSEADRSGQGNTGTVFGPTISTASPPTGVVSTGGITPLTTLIATGNTITMQGVTTTGAQTYTGSSSVTLNGALTTTANGNVTVTAASSITANSGITANGSGTVTLTANGGASNITAGGAIDSGSGLITLQADNNITLNSGGTVGASTTGAITIAADADASGAGTLTTSAAIGNASAAGAITLSGNDMVLGASITGSGALTLKPSTAARNITIGADNASDFALNPQELAYLTDGFNSITIGRSSDATGTVTLNPASLNDPVTIVGGTFSLGRLTSRNFNGSSDYIDYGNASNLQLTTGTMDAWIKTSDAGSSYRGVVGKQWAFGMYLKDNVLMIYDFNTGLDRSTGVNLADNTWHHVSVSFQSGVSNGTILYIDGVASLTTTMTVSNQANPLEVGYGNCCGQFFGGLIQDVHVYNRVLNGTEISQLKQAPGSITNGLQLYSPLQGASPESDYSGTGNTGTLTGTSTSATTAPVNIIYAGTNAVTLTARTGLIQGSGAGIDINAGGLTATAVTGIGNTTQLVTSGLTSGSATTSGAGAAAVNIANSSASATTLSSLATVGANAPITFAQSGGGALTIASATTTDGAITLSNAAAALTATTVTAGGSSRNISLTTTTSGTLSAGALTATGDSITLTSAGSIIDTGAISAGLILGQAATNVTLNGTVSATGGGDSLVLVAGGNFINNTGASALTPGAGRWLVYSTNPALDTRGGLAYNFKQYNAIYGVTVVLGTGNGFLYTIAPSITPSLIGSVTKVYDSTITATLAGGNYAVSGAIDGDTVTLNNPASGSYDTANVGVNKNVAVAGLAIASATNGAATVYGYQLGSTTANANIGTITAKALTITAQTNSKTYDSTTSAAAVPVVVGLVGSDTVTGKAETYDTANAGVGKTLSVSAYTVNDGNGGGNYTVTTVADVTGAISAKALTITAQTNSKTYDSTTSAAAVPVVVGLVGSDTVTGKAETYDTANAGIGKTLSVSAYTVNDGNSGNNYTVTTVNDTTGVISAKALTITAQTNSKTYDSTTSAAAVPVVVGLVGSDTVTGKAETYDTANAGVGKTLSVSAYTVNDGNSGNNYTVTTVNDTTGVISAKALTITAQTNSKTYDSTTSAAAVPVVVGLVGSDTVTGKAETYDTANAGVGKTLSVSAYTVNDGNSGNNYTVTTVADVTGVISAKALTITAQTNSKTYDSTTSAAAVPVVVGLVGSDTVTGKAETYDTANVGAGKTLSVSAYTVNDGNSGNNYTVTTVADVTGVISAKALTITAQTNSKTYDSTTSAAAVPVVVGLVGSDTVTGKAETYDTANVGAGKTLSVSAYTVNDGNSGNNYTVTTVADVTGVISAKALTITAQTNSKTYDSTTSAAAVPVVVGLVGSDTVTGKVETYATANAGVGKTLSVSAYTVNDGNSGGNYTVTTVNDTTGVISAKALTITAQTNSKTYDSTTSAAAVPVVVGLVGSDTVTGKVETYATANAGVGKTLSVSAYTVNDGNSGNNYTVTTVADVTGVISAKALTITAQTNSKTYDSTTSAAAVPVVVGLVGSDTVTGKAETYDTANVGAGKTLSVSAYTVNDGNSGNNYTVTTVADVTGVISAKALTITAQTNSKTYDSTTSAAAVPVVVGLVGSDTVTGKAETYDTANVGAGKTLSVSAYTVNDGNSGNNYTVTTVADVTGVISAKALTITAQTNSKTYDSTTSAAAVPVVVGLVGSDTVTGKVETYATANAGVGKTLSVSAYTVNDGNSGGNYTVTTVNDTTGVISAKALTITAQTNSKTYDSTTSAAAVPVVVGLVGSDTVTGKVETYATANAGVGKTLSVSAYTVNDGNSGGNYTVTTVNDTTGVISAVGLTVNGVMANNKVYDGTTVATLTTGAASVTPLGSDMVTLSSVGATGAFADPNVGMGKPVTVMGFTIGGADAGNYLLTQPMGLTADITAASLVVNGGFLTGLPGNVLYLLSGPQNGDARLLTAGVLPDNIYLCLNQKREGAVCTAAGMWHEDDGDDGPALKPGVEDDPQKVKQQAQRISVPQKSKAASNPGGNP